MKSIGCVWIVLGLCLSVPAGCTAPKSPYTTPSPERRDTSKAERLTREAVDLLFEDPDTAEELLRAALAADLFYGMAHNNLGVLHMNRGELYEAANEFEWARKLMPGSPEPRLNLGLVLERAGRIDDAIDEYESALAAAPGDLRSMQALASCRLRYDRANGDTDGLLRQITLRGDAKWRRWAHEQMESRANP